MSERVLTRHFDNPEARRIDVYEASDGYQAARKALSMSPEEVIEEVKNASLRGRGGAGFSAGMKWSFMPKDDGKPHYLCINADESEPGTFKDRLLMTKDPHQLIEGIIIAAHAIRAENAILYIRGEMWEQRDIMRLAVNEARDKGYLGENIFGTGINLKLSFATGAGTYICGEETAMLTSMEGKRGEPRVKPPFPAQAGVFGMPTTVNNVETLCNVPHILKNGAAWFAGLGVDGDGGTRIFGISGPVKRPGIYERPQGYNMKRLIFEDAGGLKDGMNLKAVIPGGSSCPVMLPDEIDIPHSFDSIRDAGSMAGSAGVIVLPDTSCMVRVMCNIARFYSHESCGQCTPCREGTYWLQLLFERIEAGQGDMNDITTIEDLAIDMQGTTICPLSDAAAMPAASFVKKFRHEFEEHVRLGRCPMDGRIC